MMFDAGQAAGYLQLAACEMGIGSCLTTIYGPDKARELLHFPADWHICIAMSFGYPADASLLTLPSCKGGRKPFIDIVNFETW